MTAEYATIPGADTDGRVGWSSRHEAFYYTAAADPDVEANATRGSVAWLRTKQAELARHRQALGLPTDPGEQRHNTEALTTTVDAAAHNTATAV